MGNSAITESNGYVGIAAPAPAGSVYPALTLTATGSTSVGRLLGPVTSGGEQLYLGKNLYYTGGSGWAADNTSGNAGLLAFAGNNYTYPVAIYVSPAGPNPRTLIPSMQFDTVGNVLVNGGGNVGIGITSPSSKLAVSGIISATEVNVTATPSDYVFDRDYRLTPLSEVANYIHENHHLPGIPSGAEVQEKGVSLGDMQSKLLAKIEELTLHMIQAEKENQELRERVARLEGQNAR